MNVDDQFGWLKFELPRDVLADTNHLAAAARARFFFIRQVVLMANLRQFIPVNLASPATLMLLTSVSASASGVADSDAALHDTQISDKNDAPKAG